MGPADALSRKDEIETGDDNREITLLKGHVMVQGMDIIFSIVPLPPLSFDSPFTFIVSTMFSRNTFCYMVQ